MNIVHTTIPVGYTHAHRLAGHKCEHHPHEWAVSSIVHEKVNGDKSLVAPLCPECLESIYAHDRSIKGKPLVYKTKC